MNRLTPEQIETRKVLLARLVAEGADVREAIALWNEAAAKLWDQHVKPQIEAFNETVGDACQFTEDVANTIADALTEAEPVRPRAEVEDLEEWHDAWWYGSISIDPIEATAPAADPEDGQDAIDALVKLPEAPCTPTT